MVTMAILLILGGIPVEPKNPLPLATEGPNDNNVTITTLMSLRSKTENENNVNETHDCTLYM